MVENREKDLWLIMIGMLLGNQEIREEFFKDFRTSYAQPESISKILDAVASGNRSAVVNSCSALGFEVEADETSAAALERRLRQLFQKRRYKAILAELEGVARFTPGLFLSKFKDRLPELERIAGDKYEGGDG